MAIPDLTAIRDWCVGKFQPKGDYALTSSIPTATSQLANDSEYVDQTSLNLSLAGKANNAYSNSIVNGYDYETGTVSVGSNVGNTISNSIASHDNALNDIISGVISNKEKITNLGGFTPVIDETTGEITGYKTAIGGADTVFPFSSSVKKYSFTGSVFSTSGGTKSAEIDITSVPNYDSLTLDDMSVGATVCTVPSGGGFSAISAKYNHVSGIVTVSVTIRVGAQVSFFVDVYA